MENANQIKYFIYARKSSENEDRQVLSIDSQIREAKEIAEKYKLNVVEVLSESKSAKSPGRPIFNKMMERIYKGEAQGIICWKLDRLARNPVDGGQISWALQQGTIASIRALEKEYLPTDNVMLMTVEFGVANQFIKELSAGVKRGFDTKVKMGWRPGVAPLGYLNTPDKRKGTKIIKKDSQRFKLVRRMWDLMLTGNYTPPQILEIANEEWGFRTRKFRKIGGGPLSRSGIYKIFTNPFYTGYFEFNGKEYKGKHEAMITLEEYDRVQFLLGKKGKIRPKKHAFAFTGLIKCEECGCLYTAETKKKLIKKTGEIREYTYYHCTRKTQKIKCTQNKSVREDVLEEEMKKELEKYEIAPQFQKWALKILNESNDEEIQTRTQIFNNQQKTSSSLQKELDELTKMRYRNLIDDKTFLKEKDGLQTKIEKLKKEISKTELRAENWLKLTEEAFNFITYAKKEFSEGGLELKKEIMRTLGKTFIIKDQKLSIEISDWLIPIKKGYPALKKEYERLELDKNLDNSSKKEALASLNTQWLWW
ncbi:MAG TPA: recombinase family protein [Candidatus Pacearchaeota archaeon]|nr:recombinase family protein [Candidatus Pacearchaeota archaeon]